MAEAEKKVSEDSDERLSKFIAAWVKYLESNKVSSLVEDTKLNTPVTIDSTATLEEAAKVLKETGVKSCPIVFTDAKTKEGKFVGLLDLGSILKYCIREKYKADSMFGKGFFTENAAPPITPAKFPDSKDTKQSPLLYLARMKKFVQLGMDASLLELAQALKKSPAVGVTKGDKLIAVVSQGHFTKAINASKCLEEFDLTVGELFALKKVPTSVDQADSDTILLEVFNKMGKLNRSAFAIVDKESKKFLGALNIKDTNSLKEMSNKEAKCNVAEYLGKKKESALTCSKSMKLVDAMTKICSKRTHRMWILEGGKVVSLVSLTDVLALVS